MGNPLRWSDAKGLRSISQIVKGIFSGKTHNDAGSIASGEVLLVKACAGTPGANQKSCTGCCGSQGAFGVSDCVIQICHQYCLLGDCELPKPKEQCDNKVND